MAVKYFTPNFQDRLTGTPRRDIFSGRRLASISDADVIHQYQRKDVIDIPGRFSNRRGRPAKLRRAWFTQSFGQASDLDVLISRTSSMKPFSAAVIKLQTYGGLGQSLSTVLLVNNGETGWSRGDGFIFLDRYVVSGFNYVSII